jgi:hypothetical protein
MTTVAAALATLAALPDHIADSLGWRVDPDTGDLTEPCRREDWRQGLLAGTVDPDGFLESVRMIQAVDAQPDPPRRRGWPFVDDPEP